MKTRLLLAWLLIATCMSAQAQTQELEYRPFVQEGKVFKIQGLIKEDFTYTEIEGDTLINGETWKKVYNSMPWAGRLNHSYFAAVREVDKKVYAIAKGSDRPRLLYDFNIGYDDSVDRLLCGIEGSNFGCLVDFGAGEACDKLLGFDFRSRLYLDDIDTVRLGDGLEYRRLTLILTDKNFGSVPIADSIVWIEGLGSATGPFSPWMPRLLYPEDYGDGPVYETGYYINGQLITTSSSFYESATPSAISTPKPAKEHDDLYDIQGRKLSGKPARGIYIEDGKKVLLK